MWRTFFFFLTKCNLPSYHQHLCLLCYPADDQGGKKQQHHFTKWVNTASEHVKCIWSFTTKVFHFTSYSLVLIYHSKSVQSPIQPFSPMSGYVSMPSAVEVTFLLSCYFLKNTKQKKKTPKKQKQKPTFSPLKPGGPAFPVSPCGMGRKWTIHHVNDGAYHRSHMQTRWHKQNKRVSCSQTKAITQSVFFFCVFYLIVSSFTYGPQH